MSATIFPTGVTIYNPEKCWSGYTIFQAAERGALLIDMNGNEVRMWEGLQGFPNKMLPGGYVMGSLGERNPKYGLQDQTDLVQVDWDGNIVWKFDKAEYIEDPGEEPQWMARQHHDYQREGNTVGYYVPGSDPKTNSGNTLILAHKNVHVPAISDKMLLDDVIYEVDWDGDIVWEWKVSDHFEELGFDAIARNLMYRDPNYYTGFGNSHIAGDWVHTNSMSVLGPNKWYDAGDKRFHPDNIIIDCRDANIILIIEKTTGETSKNPFGIFHHFIDHFARFHLQCLSNLHKQIQTRRSITKLQRGYVAFRNANPICKFLLREPRRITVAPDHCGHKRLSQLVLIIFLFHSSQIQCPFTKSTYYCSSFDYQ
jgi:hypothetical protein